MRFDRLQWLLEVDREVAEMLLARNDTVPCPMIPDSIPPAGRNSYSQRYRIWYAIYTVMSRKPDVRNKNTGKIKEVEDYVYELKLTL